MRILRFLILAFLLPVSLSCDRPGPVDDMDREEEVPVEDTFEPIPTEIP